MIGAPMATAAPEPAVRVSLRQAAREAGMTPRTFLKNVRIAERKGWIKVQRFSADEYGFTPMIPEGFERVAD
ncbi:hypothetical protein [Paraburkholderia oxyphila]|uniref:hypothetical protein n=1 Tax=Paraburkholderia oxyphila TaxID=614212 RepID=UPI0012EDE26D|nr:hypothetical protein [Paraburkholderia oxyphila]